MDAGGTLVDTADIYAEGESERILGALLTDLVPRHEVVLATNPQLVTLMLVTTSAGLMMLFTGVKKRHLRWRTEPRERRRRHRR